MMAQDEPDTIDLARLGPRHARDVRRRRLVVERYGAALARDGLSGVPIGTTSKEFLARLRREGTPISAGTLAAWWRAWRADGLAGLIDHRQRRRPATARPPRLFLAEVLRVRRTGRGYPVATCHFLALRRAEARGWKTWTLRETIRYVKRIESATPPAAGRVPAPEAVKRPPEGRSTGH